MYVTMYKEPLFSTVIHRAAEKKLADEPVQDTEACLPWILVVAVFKICRLNGEFLKYLMNINNIP